MWEAVAGATSYDFQIALDSGFVTVVVNHVAQSDIFVELQAAESLGQGLTYYWRVRANDGGGSSAWVVQQLPIARKWVDYVLQVTTDASFNVVDVETDPIRAATEYTLQPHESLVAGNTYNWRVIASDLAGNTVIAGPNSFPLVDGFAPTIPAYIFPPAQESIVNAAPRFNWTDASDPNGVTYTIQLATDAGMANLLVNQSGSLISNFQLSQAGALTPGARYYWRVGVEDNLNNFAWGPIEGFDVAPRFIEYNVEIASDAAFTQYHTNVDGLQGTSYTVPPFNPLLESLRYYWRVFAADGSGNTQQSNETFEILLADQYPPSLPNLTYPATEATVINPAITFDWSDGFDNSGFNYRLQVASDAGFANVLVDQPSISSGTSFFQIAAGAIAPARYFWRVEVIDTVGNRAFTPSRAFTLRAREVEYEVVIATDQGFGIIHTSQTGLETEEYTLDASQQLTEGTTYYWQVRARDLGNNITTSTNFFELTLADTYPPSIPDVIYPRIGEDPINVETTFIWTAAEDGSAVTYRYQLASDSGFTNLLVDETGLVVTNYTLSPGDALARGSLYYWRLEVEDAFGNRQWGPAWAVRGGDKTITYEIQAFDLATPLVPVLAESGITSQQYDTPGHKELDEGATYEWQVTATDPAGNAASSSTNFQFTLVDAYAPSLPEIIYPANNATVLNQLVPFVWTVSTDPSGVNYTLEIATDAGMANIVRTYPGLTGTSYQLLAGNELVRGQRYFWRVNVADNIGNAQDGAVWSVTVDPRTVLYDLEVSTDNTFVAVDTLVSALQVADYTLQAAEQVNEGVTYYWRVTATDTADNSVQSSATFEFEIADLFAPSLPVPLYPEPDGLSINDSPTFMWSESFDTNNVTYTFEIATDAGYTNVLESVDVGANRSYTTGLTLTRGARYFWRLRVEDDLGNAQSTPGVAVTIDPKATVYDLVIATDASLSAVHAEAQQLIALEYTLQQAQAIAEGVTYYWQVRATDVAANQTLSTSIFELEVADLFGPSRPDPLYPEPGSTVINPVVTFDWSDSTDTNGASYTFELATDAGFTNIILTRNTGVTSRYTLAAGEALNRGERYFWRVSPFDGLGNVTVGTPIEVNIDAKALRYSIDISRDVGFATIETSGLDLSGLEYTLQQSQALTEGVDYYWRVTVEDPSANTTQSTSVFQLHIVDNFAPSLPMIVYPANLAIVANDAVTFAWTPAQDPSTPITYELQVATDAGMTNIIVSEPNLTATNYTLVAGQALTRGDRFFWRVVVTDSLGNSQNGAIWIVDIDPKTVRYALEVAEDSSFSVNHVNVLQLTAVEYTLAAAEAVVDGRTYYWRVHATDAAQNSADSSAVFEFQLADIYAPSLPEPIYPVNLADVVNPEVPFVWTQSQDSNGVEYTLEVASDAGFANLVVNRTGLTATNYQLGAGEALPRGRRYFWRLRVEDNLGNAGVAGPWILDVQDKSVHFHLEVAEDAGFATVVLDAENLQTAEYQTQLAEAFDEATTYYWRVTAADLAANDTAANGQFEFTLADNFAPSLPMALYPEPDGTVLNPQLTFHWTDSQDPSTPITYDFQIATDVGFTNLLVNVTDVGATNYTLNAGQALTPGLRYFWRVIVTDAIGNSAAAPGWAVTIGARQSRYEFELARDAAFTQIVTTESGIAQAEYTLDEAQALTEGQTYYWRVRAFDAASNQTPSASEFEFSLADIYPPSAPEAIYPADNATIINERPTMYWTGSFDPSGVLYTLELASDAGFQNILVTQAGLGAPGYTLDPSEVLNRGERYFWRVVVTDNVGNSGSSPIWSFLVRAKAVEYTLEIAEDAGFTQIHADQGRIATTEFLLQASQALLEGRTYYWRVTATDIAANASQSTSVFEMTLVDAYPPSEPLPLYPPPGEDVINDEVTFQWTNSIDSNGVNYDLQIAADSGFVTVLLNQTGLTSSSYTLTPGQALARGATHYWRLRLYDDLGNSVWTPVWSVRVVPKSTTYAVEIAEDAAFTVIHAEAASLTNPDYLLPPAEQVTEDTTYYWRATGSDLAGNSVVSTSVFEFSVTDVFPPSPPLVLYPPHGSTVINDQVTFVWSQSTDPNGVAYRLQIAGDSGFVNVLVDEPALSPNNYTLPIAQSLQRGNLYYWRVGVSDTQNNFAWGSTWAVSVIDKVVEYNIRIAEDAAFTQLHLENGSLLPTEFTPEEREALSDGVAYWWNIIARDLAGNQTNSTSTFELQLADVYPPTEPIAIFPAEDTTIINPTLTFVWSEAFDSSTVNYGLQVATDVGFANVVIDEQGLNAPSYTLIGGQTLNGGLSYYWRIRVTDGVGNTAVGPTWAFELQEKSVDYRFELGSDINFTVVEIDEVDIEFAEYTPNVAQQLTEGQSYWWRVTATDLAGNAQSSTSVFELQLIDVYAPPFPALVYPADGAMVINNRITFDWADVVDPNNVRYGLEVATDLGFVNVLVSESNLNASFYTLSQAQELNRDDRYYWRVLVEDDLGNAGVGPVWSVDVSAKSVEYALTLAEDAAFTQIHLGRDEIAASDYTLEPYEAVVDGRTYYWRVDGRDLAGNITPSTSTFEFQLADVYAPSVPVALYPLDGAVVINVEPTFVWSQAVDSNGVQYRFQLASDSGFTNVLIDRANLSVTDYEIQPLEALTRGNLYYWRVGVIDNIGNSAWSDTWAVTADPKTVVYGWELAEDAAFTTVHAAAEALEVIEYILQPFQQLVEGTTYYWRVSASDTAGNRTPGNSTFELSLADIYPPSVPTIIYPPQMATVINPEVTFDWSTAIDPNGVEYTLQISDDAVFANIVFERAGLNPSTYTLAPGEALTRGTRYYWRIEVRDNLGNFQYTTTWQFTLDTKDVLYELQIAEDAGFAVIHAFVTQLGAAEYTLTVAQEVSDGIQYFWRVVAEDDAGQTQTSNSVYEFSLTDVYPPPLPIAIYPADGATVINPAVTFDWSSVQDSNGVTYDLEIADIADFSNIVITQPGLADSFHTLTGAQVLTRGTTYYWRLRVVDGLGNEDFTAGWSFTLRDKDVEYALDIATDQGFGVIVVGKDQLTSPEYDLQPFEGLTEGVLYYWHVTATDIAGNTAVSNADFTLQLADSFPPSLPALLYPLADAEMANDRVSFVWSQAQDPSAPVEYTLYIATDANFTNTILTEAVQGTSWTLNQGTALARGGEYWWRISAADALNNSVSTTGQRFTVRDKETLYRLEVATDAGFGVIHVDQAQIAALEYTLQPFEGAVEGVTYYWRVTAQDIALNTAVSTSVFEFQLADNFPPAAPVHLYPLAASTVINPQIGFDWSDSVDPAGAVTYRLEVADDVGFTNVVIDQPNLAVSEFSATLTRDTRYYWRVTASDPLGNAATGPEEWFDISDKTLQYDFQLSTDQAFTSFVIQVNDAQNLEYAVQPYEALADSQTYYWRVRAVDIAGNETYATPFEFTLVDMYPPGIPDLLYPLDGVAVINPRVAFDWTETTDSSGVVTYGIQIATDDQFMNIVEQQTGLTGTDYQPMGALARNSRYYWRVQVQDGAGNVDFSPGYQLEVQPKVRYFLEVAEDPTFNTMHYIQRGLSVPDHTLSSTTPVTVGQTYYWRTTAIDGAGQQTPSTSVFEFTVDVPSLTTALVTPFSQPERADFIFEASRPVDWTLELRERVGGICGRLVHRTTDTALTSITGTWPGLSPGAEYCWNALAVDGTGMIGDNSTFALAPLPTFVTNPSYARTGINVDVAAEISAAGLGSTEYNEGTCGATTHSALSFDGGDLLNVPGHVITRDAFTVEAWVFLDSAAQTSDLLLTEAPYVRLSLNGGNLRLQMNTDNGQADFETTGPIPDGQWSHIAVVYSGTEIRLYIDAQNLRNAAWTGTVLEGGTGFIVGNFANGLQGDITSMAVHRRGLTGTEVGNRYLAGAFGNNGELPPLADPNDTIAQWNFDEATDVQSAYDATGRHHAGVLGANHLAENFDPTRSTAFANSVQMNNGTNLAVQLTNMPGGPDYCGRVIAQTAVGWIASRPWDDFTRNTDLEDPEVTLNYLTVRAECTGNASRTMRRDFEPDPPVPPPAGSPDGIGTPDATDDVTAPEDLIIVAHLGSQMGMAMPVQYAFPMGDTLVYWSAQDEAGNLGWPMTGMNVQAQTIIIEDTTLPSVTGGAEVLVEATDPNGTPYTPTPESATDSCSAPTVTHDPAGPYDLGSHTITFTADDGLNTAQATRIITIVDTTAPVFDPALGTLTVAHDGSACFSFTPPNPAIRDNGYPLAQLTIDGVRTSNPPNPACWLVGTHTYEWTIADPEGNTRVESQTIEVTMGTLLVSAPTLEVAGVPAPTFGRYYNNTVTVVFSVANGTAPYAVTVSPTPDNLVDNNNTFRATYSTPGAYERLLIVARDQNGMGPNFGSRVVNEGFGIDLTPPVISADLIELATSYDYLDPATYPFLFMGESLSLEKVHVRDGERAAEDLGYALDFDGTDDFVEVPNAAALNISDAFSIQTWFYLEAYQEAPLVSKDSGIGIQQYALTVDAQGQANFLMTQDGFNVVVLTGGEIQPRTWHHVAATFDGQVARMYFDGEPVDYGVAPGTIMTGTGPLRVGGYLVGSPLAAYFTGQITDVALWNEAIDAELVNVHYRGGAGRRVNPALAGRAAVYHFDGNTQVIEDSTGNGSDGSLGATVAVDVDDPARVRLRHPADNTASGIVRVEVKLVNTANGNESVMVLSSSTAAGSPLRVGNREVFGHACNGTVGGVCNPGEPVLRAELIRSWAGNQADGVYSLEIEATDAAGNTATYQVGLQTTDYEGALAWAHAEILRQLDPMNSVFCLQCVEEAELETEVALSYWTMGTRYGDGSFLRAHRAVDAILESEDQGDDFGPLTSYVARAMLGEYRQYIAQLGANLHPDDTLIYADGQVNLVNAEFERHNPTSLPDTIIILVRDGYDEVAVLYPAYQEMRSRLRAVRGRWTFMLDAYQAGSIDELPLMNDTVRIIAVQQLMTASRNMLRETIWREVEAALQNQFTTQVAPLEDIKDVIEKDDPNDPDEEDHLLRVNNPAVTDACLDLLASLQLTDDRRFAKCYLELNTLASDLEGVQESEVHTKRWRAGLTLVLFNMLELSMFVSPTGLPFVVEPGPPQGVVLPDVLQANYTRATPVSAVPANGDLIAAYAAHEQAQTALLSGDTDQAFFNVFLPQRCLLLGLYNQFYSTNNAVPNVADPKEAPLIPADEGCAP